MKLTVLGAVALPIVAAHNVQERHNFARQNAAAAPASSSVASVAASSAVASSAAASGSVVASGPAVASSAAATFSSLPTVSWSLLSTNPTAVPISDLVPGTLTTQPQLGASTTFAPGTQPTVISNAPPLPNWQTLSPASYPTLDRAPPTDSPEVQQWIKEVNASGIAIPNLAPTQPGGCAANAQFAADQSRCWWTCGGCVRDSDISDCPDPYTWGLTYDDGPALYTPNLLNYLDQNDLKSTFFAVGSRVISYPALLQEEYMAGHQIAVHTWSHPAMTTVSTEGIIAELGWSKKVIKDVLGVTPLYWRPPYGDIDDRVRAISKAMGLEPIMWTRISPTATFDTGDFNVAGGTTSASQVLQNWQNIMGNVSTLGHGFIVLEHDLFAQTVDIATGYILPDALAFTPKLDIKPVISCLNKPMTDAYLETNDNSSNPLPTASSVNPTFSSGQTGSAQATGNTSGNTATNQSGAVAVGVSSSLFMAGVSFVAFFAGLAVLL